MKKIVILSGAGISKESGIDTFRDADGMWLEYDPRELASTTALKNQPGKVLEFYNSGEEFRNAGLFPRVVGTTFGLRL